MRRYLKVLVRFLKLSWMESTEYRLNFVVWVLVETGWTIMDLVMFKALLSNINSMGGWTFPQVLILVGVYRMMGLLVWGWMFHSFSKIPTLISKGNLDLVLTKPMNSQFLVSVSKYSFTSFSSLIGGFIYVLVGLHMLQYYPTFPQIILTLLALVVSTALMYGLYFSTVALSLYVERLNNIFHIFLHAFDSSRFPAEIFPVFLQRLLTTVLPIAVMITIPAGLLISKFNYIDLIKLSILAVLFVGLSIFIWHNGLRRYSSASS